MCRSKRAYKLEATTSLHEWVKDSSGILLWAFEEAAFLYSTIRIGEHTQLRRHIAHKRYSGKPDPSAGQEVGQ